MDEFKTKKDLQVLLNYYKENKGDFKNLSETDTETKLIQPLFSALGWTVNDIRQQEKTVFEKKRGRADFAFRINSRIAFYLEVKKTTRPLDAEAERQVISYASSKRVPFAVLTNFEQMKIFCVGADSSKAVFRTFNRPEDYVDNFHNLSLLTRESFEKGTIFKIAESEERLKKRVFIDKTLLGDLMLIRRLIAQDLEKHYPNKYEVTVKDEIIQRIIDRLIFIRRSEDVNINPENLILKEISISSDVRAYGKLKEIFAVYNRVYNSGLFAVDLDNDCDKITISGDIIKRLINYLYTSEDGKYDYNFDWIDADVLGQVYEQYLGIILQQAKSGKSRLKSGQAHRKEQGIYYTPTYVVDFIVKNTVGNVLKNKKINPNEIKVLDPACGSGSFLIKAFDYLSEALGKGATQHKLDSQSNYSYKTGILKENIFGMDLDQKAVEITKLNLLLKASEPNRKLPPEIDLHIRQGDSLIKDETVGGLNAFKWLDDFSENSFDCVIGNPPYLNSIQLGKTYGDTVKEYWKKNYESAKGTYDIYILFFEQALRACKPNGYVAFITPNKFLSSPYAVGFRKLIKENHKLIRIVDLAQVKVFDDPSVYPIITIFQKAKPKEEYEIIIERIKSENMDDKTSHKVSSKILGMFPENVWGALLSENMELTEKIFENSTPLEEVAEVQATSTASESDEFSKFISEKNDGLSIINTGTIDRYRAKYGVTKFMNKGEKLLHPKLNILKINENRRNLYKSPKIIFAKLALRVEAFFDSSGEYASINTNCVHTPKPDYSLEYLIAILNSNLMSYIYSELFQGLRMSGGFYQFQSPQLRLLPIKKSDEKTKNKLKELVIKIQQSNTQLNKFGDVKSSASLKISEEITRLDKEIDGIVYGIYGMTEKEKKIIENSISG